MERVKFDIAADYEGKEHITTPSRTFKSLSLIRLCLDKVPKFYISRKRMDFLVEKYAHRDTTFLGYGPSGSACGMNSSLSNKRNYKCGRTD